MRIISRYGFPVCILTKSALIERDIDILSGMKNLEVGFTITCPEEGDRRILEPFSSPTQERLGVLKRFSEAGLETYAFLM